MRIMSGIQCLVLLGAAYGSWKYKNDVAIGILCFLACLQSILLVCKVVFVSKERLDLKSLLWKIERNIVQNAYVEESDIDKLHKLKGKFTWKVREHFFSVFRKNKRK